MKVSEKKLNNKKRNGFTLAELLVVVAIIGVLVAIAIPVFSNQLEKSREATDMANIRGAYAEVTVEAISDNDTTLVKTVSLKQKNDGWDVNSNKTALEALGDVSGEPAKDGTCEISWQSASGKVLFSFSGSSSGGEPALPEILESDTSNVMAEKYGIIVSYLFKNYPMTKLNTRDGYFGEGTTNAEKVKIITAQTGDNETKAEIQNAMKDVGYTDNDINAVYKSLRAAYLDEEGNLLGYHGPASGGSNQLYIVGYDKNPVSVGGSVEAKNTIAKFIQTGAIE